MGGNALTLTQTRRYAAAEYHALVTEVTRALQARLPDARLEAVRSYNSKPDFGDLDILVENLDAKNRLEPVLPELGITEVVKNGPVWSLGWRDFQVDLLFQATEDYDFARGYFAYNDLGNLCGRIAYGMGFKFGHDGLHYVVRDGDYKVAELTLTKDFDKALAAIGMDVTRFHQGFETLEEVFHYVITAPYFDMTHFSLENRAYRSRIRDAKRATYNAFLQFADEYLKAGKHRPNPLLALGQSYQLLRLRVLFPQFSQELDSVLLNHAHQRLAKSVFNGKVVGDQVGLEGKELGAFMTKLRTKLIMAHGDNWQHWLINARPEEVTTFIQQAYNRQLDQGFDQLSAGIEP